MHRIMIEHVANGYVITTHVGPRLISTQVALESAAFTQMVGDWAERREEADRLAAERERQWREEQKQMAAGAGAEEAKEKTHGQD